jgi:hypothetical protein
MGQRRGRPWQPGQTGNPHGRPPRGLTLAERLRAELARVSGEDGVTTRGDELARVLVDLAISGDVQAIRTVLERVDGKVTDPVELTSAGGAPFVFTLRLGGRGEADDDDPDPTTDPG